MLSRLDDARVFTGSHDVIFSASSSHIVQQTRREKAALNGQKAARKTLQQHRQASGSNNNNDDDEEEEDGSDALDGSSDGGDDDDGEDDDADEEEAFRDSRHPPSERYHPQHPYNAQLNALAKTAKSPRGKIVRRSSKGNKASVMVYDNDHPMEFVFLPNGEIRPRDECPPGLALPPPASIVSGARHLLPQHAFAQQQNEYLHEQKQQPARRTLSSAPASRGITPRQRNNVAEATTSAKTDRGVRSASRSRSLSDSSDDSSSSECGSSQSPTGAARRRQGNGAAVSVGNDGSESGASEPSEPSSSEYDHEEKENIREQGQRAAAQKQNHKVSSSPKRVGVKKPVSIAATRSSSVRNKSGDSFARKQKQSDRSDRQPQGEYEEEQQSERKLRAASARQQSSVQAAHESSRKVPLLSPSSASDDSRASWSYRPKAVKYDDLHTHQVRLDETRQKKSTKMDVRDLLGEKANVSNARPKPAKDHSEKIEYLEEELQKEKKRVLEKMTQLLEEQGKNQQLQHQLDALQSQIASKEREVELKVQEVVQSKKQSLENAESQWKSSVEALEDQLHVKDAAVLRLESENDRLKHAVSELKDKEQQDSSQSRDRESSDKRHEKIISKLKTFHSQVEHWKASSKEAMESCDRKPDLLSLVESVWLDFPPFPFLDSAKGDSDSRGVTNEHTNMIVFLKKRLRLRENELRQTHVKYVELKELCARQCVREADLQNFINEHRLRGNLIIRKDRSATNESASDARKSVQFQEQQRNDAKTKMIVNRATNTSPTYDDEQDNESEEDENYDGHDDHDDDIAGDEGDKDSQEAYYLREPKVFVQVSRDGVYEHTPRSSSAVLKKLEEEQSRARKKKDHREVERIRLIPSPTLARRYERVLAPPSEEYLPPAPRRKGVAINHNTSTPLRSANRLGRPPSSVNATRSSGAVRKRLVNMPTSVRASATRSSSNNHSIASRSSRSTAPWV